MLSDQQIHSPNLLSQSKSPEYNVAIKAALFRVVLQLWFVLFGEPISSILSVMQLGSLGNRPRVLCWPRESIILLDYTFL